MTDKPVYSTAGGHERKSSPGKSAYAPSAGPCKMRLETKGRGGKAVTVLFNLPFGEAEATALMKELQAKLGCGATFKNGAIEFRGDWREKLAACFLAKGLKLVRAGG